jgi:sulfate/thiosulfate transport system substrate-binding protein
VLPNRLPPSLTLLAAACLIPAAGCAPARGGGGEVDTLTIGAYSVVREAFREAILPGFAAEWKQKTGRSVRFEESYNASGAQSRAIASGFDADVAVLSLEGDVDRLVKYGLVDKGWKSGPNRGLISRSLVIIGVREGNPLQIRDWEDLTRSGVGVLYPDPKTSGGARWNINAIYGAGLLKDPKAPDRERARDLLARVQANVVNMDASGRQSMATFARGTGDAVVTYENELLLRQKMGGTPAPYVIPPATLLIEGPAAIVDASVKRHGNRALAEAFLAYLRSDRAQRQLAEYGFRPLDPRLEPPGLRPLPPRLFTMKQLGGWSAVNKEVYGPGGVWDSLFTRTGDRAR